MFRKLIPHYDIRIATRENDEWTTVGEYRVYTLKAAEALASAIDEMGDGLTDDLPVRVTVSRNGDEIVQAVLSKSPPRTRTRPHQIPARGGPCDGDETVQFAAGPAKTAHDVLQFLGLAIGMQTGERPDFLDHQPPEEPDDQLELF